MCLCRTRANSPLERLKELSSGPMLMSSKVPSYLICAVEIREMILPGWGISFDISSQVRRRYARPNSAERSGGQIPGRENCQAVEYTS